MGVRMSWDMLLRKSVLARLARSAATRASGQGLLALRELLVLLLELFAGGFLLRPRAPPPRRPEKRKMRRGGKRRTQRSHGGHVVQNNGNRSGGAEALGAPSREAMGVNCPKGGERCGRAASKAPCCRFRPRSSDRRRAPAGPSIILCRSAVFNMSFARRPLSVVQLTLPSSTAWRQSSIEG